MEVEIHTKIISLMRNPFNMKVTLLLNMEKEENYQICLFGQKMYMNNVEILE